MFLCLITSCISFTNLSFAKTLLVYSFIQVGLLLLNIALFGDLGFRQTKYVQVTRTFIIRKSPNLTNSLCLKNVFYGQVVGGVGYRLSLFSIKFEVLSCLYIQVTMNTVQTVGNTQHRRGPAKGRSSLDILEVITGDKQKWNNFQTI